MNKVISVLSILVLSGCGATAVQFYDGPARSKSETAVISFWTDTGTIDEKFSLSALRINSTSINDKAVETNNAISVLPGSYSVDVKCSLGQFEKITTFEVKADANNNYAIIAIGSGDECDFKKLSVLSNGKFTEL